MNPRDEELWTLRYYDEPLSDRDRRRFTDDLEFRRGYEAFRRQMEWIEKNTVDPADEPELRPEEGLADRVWSGLQPDLAPRRRKTFWRPAVAVMGVAASLFLVFLIGVEWGRDRTAITAEQKQRIVEQTMDRHLRRSGDLLTELTNLNPRATGRDLSGERDRAGQLASDNRLFRQSLAGQGTQTTLETLDSLESVLTELANLPVDADAAEILALRRRVQRLGLLLRLDLLKHSPAAPAQASPAAGTGDQV